jgi:hypothetical protein
MGAAPRFGICLFKDTHDLSLKFRKFDRKHRTPRMQDQIETPGKQLHMASQRLAHPPLDAVALVRLAQHFACRQTHAWAHAWV